MRYILFNSTGIILLVSKLTKRLAATHIDHNSPLDSIWETSVNDVYKENDATDRIKTLWKGCVSLMTSLLVTARRLAFTILLNL